MAQFGIFTKWLTFSIAQLNLTQIWCKLSPFKKFAIKKIFFLLNDLAYLFWVQKIVLHRSSAECKSKGLPEIEIQSSFMGIH